VVNFGVNDESLGDAYGAYLRQLRAAYPRTKIVALSPFNGRHSAEIAAAVKAQDDPGIRYVGTEGWLGPEDCTDGIHPSVEGHAKAAARLVDELQAITGLTPR
jgi:lysophospholipase L1-like esterase